MPKVPKTFKLSQQALQDIKRLQSEYPFSQAGAIEHALRETVKRLPAATPAAAQPATKRAKEQTR